jgi:outer membrane protein assembly factor BamD
MQSADSLISEGKRSLAYFFSVLCASLLIAAILAACSAQKEVKTDEVFDAEKSFSHATELIDKKDYEEARKLLLQIKNRDLTKKYAPYAQLKIADSYVKEEEYEPAVEAYKKFLEIYPDHKEASYAQYQIAMVYFVQIEGYERGYGAAAKALEEFEKLKKMFPRNPYREVIELRIQKCKDIIADYDFSVGQFYFNKESYNAALGRYLEVLSSFPKYHRRSQLLFDIAMSYKGLGDTAKEREYLNRLMEKYPDDRLVRKAKKELDSLGN